MALHSVQTLLSKGFTREHLAGFVEAGLMYDAHDAGSYFLGGRGRLYNTGEMLVTTKSPSSWPKEHRAIWNEHKTYSTRLNPVKDAR